MKNITFRKSLQFLLFAVLFYLYVAGNYRILKFIFKPTKEPVYCGKIFKKISSVEHYKSSTSNEFIFVIDFEKIGRHDLSVSASTFVSHEEGGIVCFEMPDRNLTVSMMVKDIITFCAGAVTVILGIFLIVCSIHWIFTGKFNLDDDTN